MIPRCRCGSGKLSTFMTLIHYKPIWHPKHRAPQPGNWIWLFSGQDPLAPTSSRVVEGDIHFQVPNAEHDLVLFRTLSLAWPMESLYFKVEIIKASLFPLIMEHGCPAPLEWPSSWDSSGSPPISLSVPSEWGMISKLCLAP